MTFAISKKLPELLVLCRRHHVAELYLFGSATGRSFGAGSEKSLSNPYFIDSVDNETVWGVVTHHLPMLKKEIDTLLK